MAQEQRRHLRSPDDEEQFDPIKYGDAFNVSGELASQLIKPGDAALMQSAENTVYGQTIKEGVAATMQSAAAMNEIAGLVGYRDVSRTAKEEGVVVTETDVPGARIFTESVGGQVMGTAAVRSDDDQLQQGAGQGAIMRGGITIGEALEAAADTKAGDRPVGQADAAATQAAEARATGNTSKIITPGGVPAFAQSAAALDADIVRDDDKIKLRDVVGDSTARLPRG